MSIQEITTKLNTQAYEAAKREFQTMFPYPTFPDAFRGTIAVIDSSSTGQDSLIALRCCLNRPPAAETTHPFFIGLRFSRFGRSTTLDLISVPFPPGCDPVQHYARRIGCLSFADRIDTQFGSRPLPSPLISAVGQMTVRAGQELTFTPITEKPATLIGVDVVLLARTIASHFDLMTTTEVANDFFISLLGFLKECQGKSDFYEQFVLWLHESRVRITPKLAESLCAMKAADHARTQGSDICAEYLKEIYSGLGQVIKSISAIQRSW